MVKQEALQAVENGRRLIDEAQRKFEQIAEERAVEAKAKIADEWTPILQKILEIAPAWAHSYAKVPTLPPDYYDDGTRLLRPVEFEIPDVGKVFAYSFPGGVRFVPVEWQVVDDEEEFTVAPTATRAYRHQYEDPGYASFDIALVYAYDFFQHIPDLQMVADQRNKDRVSENSSPVPTPESWTVKEWMRQAMLHWERGYQQDAIGAALIALVGEIAVLAEG